jgi:hypothetical protein
MPQKGAPVVALLQQEKINFLSSWLSIPIRATFIKTLSSNQKVILDTLKVI